MKREEKHNGEGKTKGETSLIKKRVFLIVNKGSSWKNKHIQLLSIEQSQQEGSRGKNMPTKPT